MKIGAGEHVLSDSLNRPAKKLRISVIDKCNFRCNFCMPQDPTWIPDDEILTFEEISRIAGIFVSLGINKIRLSGGEPLMRKGIEKLVSILSNLPGIDLLSMTTNGILLGAKASILRANGLNGVTVSLHSLKQERFEDITGTKIPLNEILKGIQVAKNVGLDVKINTVAIKNCNEDEILDFTNLAYEGGSTVRFIEYMPFDGKKLWGMEKVFSGNDIIAMIRKEHSIVENVREHGSTAQLYSFTNGSKGKIGIITSMTKPFCGDCDRVRLKADGKLVPCLFSSDEYDLKPLLRNGASNREINAFIKDSYFRKSPGVEVKLKNQYDIHHIRPMYTIGG